MNVCEASCMYLPGRYVIHYVMYFGELLCFRFLFVVFISSQFF